MEEAARSKPYLNCNLSCIVSSESVRRYGDALVSLVLNNGILGYLSHNLPPLSYITLDIFDMLAHSVCTDLLITIPSVDCSTDGRGIETVAELKKCSLDRQKRHPAPQGF